MLRPLYNSKLDATVESNPILTPMLATTYE